MWHLYINTLILLTEIPSINCSISNNFNILFAWVIGAFVKTHGLTFVRLREDKNSVSAGDGFNTSSNQIVPRTSRVNCKASKRIFFRTYSVTGDYRYGDVALILEQLDYVSRCTLSVLCLLLFRSCSSVWPYMMGSASDHFVDLFWYFAKIIFYMWTISL